MNPGLRGEVMRTVGWHRSCFLLVKAYPASNLRGEVSAWLVSLASRDRAVTSTVENEVNELKTKTEVRAAVNLWIT